MSKELTAGSAVSAMSANVNIGIDEVVSVFVTKYEDQLFDRKTDLSARIKQTKQELTDLENKLKSGVDTSQYESKMPVLGLTSTVESVKVRFNNKLAESNVAISVKISDDDDRSRYSGSLTKTFEVSISSADFEENKSLKEKLENLNTELMEVMGLIKSVSRKERQIRGKISEMKLKESGFESLLESEEMLSLVQLS